MSVFDCIDANTKDDLRAQLKRDIEERMEMYGDEVNEKYRATIAIQEVTESSKIKRLKEKYRILRRW